MASLALLLFSCNDLARAVRLIHESAAWFDESVLIDSSAPAEYDQWRERLANERTTVHRVLPIGYVDLLRPYGVRHVRSDRVLILDTDESISPPLRGVLRSLDGSDGYLIPRHELSIHAYTYHLRLFRPSAVTWGSRSWGAPHLKEPVVTLPRQVCITHSDQYARYLDREDRAWRVRGPESYERPFTTEYARRELFPLPVWRGSSPPQYLSEPAVRVLLDLDFLRRLLRSGNLRLSRFFRTYDRARWDYTCSLDWTERERRLEIHREILRARGLRRYLGFDDPEYVDRLSASFAWSHDGPWVFEWLVAYRHEHGHPLESFHGS